MINWFKNRSYHYRSPIIGGLVFRPVWRRHPSIWSSFIITDQTHDGRCLINPQPCARIRLVQARAKQRVPK